MQWFGFLKRHTCASLLALYVWLCSCVVVADEFSVDDIRIEGLQRVSSQTVFASLPINIGDVISADVLRSASRNLFRLGLFNDIQLFRDGNALLIKVVELPTVTGINIEGNEAIKTDMLLDGLKRAGLSEGKIFKRSTLERIALELERQYVAQGRYDAKVIARVIRLPRNRVSLDINVNEGNVASIEHINIVGNTVFGDEELKKTFKLQETGFWSWYTSDNKYSREKLAGDLETLQSYYMDRGYIRFNVESTQVSISPNKKGVYITINVSEGERYDIRNVSLAGKLILPESTLESFVLVKKGDTFSRRLVNTSGEFMSKRLGKDGYAFAKVDGIPNIDDDKREVDITFFVEPGERTYVRRINFTGNDMTQDEVMRREMVQMEGGLASTDSIDIGKRRLNQLGFFKEVSVSTPRVPGHNDLIDVNYNVEEQSTGSLNFTLGYSDGTGFLLGASVSQKNFLGTGNSASIGAQRNNSQQSYNFSFNNPYFTVDGVSSGFNLYYRKVNFDRLRAFNSYQLNSKGGDINFGYPISRRQRLSFSFGINDIELLAGSRVSTEITNFIEDNGNDYIEYVLGTNWRYNNLNRGLFPTDGTEHKVGLSTALPGGDLTYYKLNYTANFYFPLYNEWVLRLRTELGYGNGYNGQGNLPFFRNYRAGGMGSVRGYTSGSLGPKGLPPFEAVPLAKSDASGSPVFATNPDGTFETRDDAPRLVYVKGSDGIVRQFSNPKKRVPVAAAGTEKGAFFTSSTRTLGGNILAESSLELIFPTPFIEDRRSVRSVVFLDAGTTFTDQCYTPSDDDIPSFTQHPFCQDGIDADAVRIGAGVAITWVTAIAPLTFSYSFPLNDKENDLTESFEFTLGQVF